MLLRIITAVISFVLLVPFLIFSDTFMLVIFAALLGLISVYELFDCLGKSKDIKLIVPSLVFSATIIILTRSDLPSGYHLKYTLILIFIYLFYMLSGSVFSKGRVGITDSTMAFTMTVYVTFGFSSIIALRDTDYGRYIYLLAFIIPWTTDIFAYFGGKIFGKHKLIPNISPKKTVEGSICGTIAAPCAACLYACFVSKNSSLVPIYGDIIAVSLLLSIISQIGDLIASAVKRHYDVKDYGNIFPGHGGVLDRFDSIIPASIFLYIHTISEIFRLFY